MDLSTRLHLLHTPPFRPFGPPSPSRFIPYLFVLSARIFLPRRAVPSLSFLEAHQRLTKYLARSSPILLAEEEEDVAVVTARRFKRYCFTPCGKREKCEVELAGNSFVSIPNCRKTRSNVVLVFSFPVVFRSPLFYSTPVIFADRSGNTRREREMLRTESLLTNYIYCNILEIVYFLFLIILRENFNNNFSLFLSFLLSFTVVYRDASLIDPSLIKQGDSLRCRIRGKDIANRS